MELDFSQASSARSGNDEDSSGSSRSAAKASRSNLADAIGTGGVVIPANATRIIPVDGVVRLPAGTRLDAIQLSGRDLIVTLPDGQVLVIVDGALHTPQIILGTIRISAANIAALIAGQEPEPAAGAPQSSGGNFAETPGDIGDPFALGNLLPPTEFGFAQAEEKELIPAAIDNEPEILIVTVDQPLGSTTATATVSEGALAARGMEPAGSDPASTAETVTGTIQFTSLDQPSVVSVNGIPITAVGQTVSTPLGLITITSITPDAIGYSYTLIDNSTDPNATEAITITVSDGDGDIATATLTIAVTDDGPTARADTESVAPNLYNGQTGNVITGAGTASGAAGADTLGADGATVTGIHSATSTVFTVPGTDITGQYGRLLINADGSYSYVRSAGTPGGVADIFTYQLTDGDGDTSTATLTINIADGTVGLVVPSTGDDGTVVDEAGLSEREDGPPGSRDGDGSNLTVGVIYFDAPDGVASITINGIVITGEGQEIELPTGTLIIGTISPGSLEYGFVLTDNIVGGAASQPIEVTVKDQDGDSASANFVIDILDDVPTAVGEADSVLAGAGNGADGNVLTGIGGTDTNTSDGKRDMQGADGATLTAISFGGNSGSIGGTTTGAYGTLKIAANGSYLYTLDDSNIAVLGLNGNESLTETFTYTITDGDGDESSAALIVTIRGRNDIVTISGLNPEGAEATVSEANLPDGSAPDGGVLTKTGSFSFDAADGISGITIGGEVLFNGSIVPGLSITTDNGILTITNFAPLFGPTGEIIGGTISYSYRLTDNTLFHTGVSGGALTESFAIAIVDSDWTTAAATLDVVIVDDNPEARAAPAITVAEDAPAVSGNLLSDDALGADGATVTSVNVGGVNVAVLAAGTTSYSNAVGTYTFQAGGAWTFDPVSVSSAAAVNAGFTYTITDGDGDQSTAQQQISVTDGANSKAGTPISLTLDDQHLETGSTPSLIQPVSTTGQIQFTAGSDPIALIIFGDISGLDGGLSWTRESDTEIVGWDTDIPIIRLTLTVTGTTATVVATLESNYAHHPDVTADDLAALGSVGVIATDSDGDQTIGTVNLSVSDDVPTISSASPTDGVLTVDETNLAINATANFANLFNVAMGADQLGTVTYAFVVTTASGLIDVATGAKINMQSFGNVVEGRLVGSPSIVAFRLTIAADGQATLDQLRAVRHENPGNPDDIVTLSSTLIQLVATVTDADGDQAFATALVGAALVFKDDGPAIDASSVDTNSILLTTQDGDTRGAAFDVATADLSPTFVVAVSSYGADGPNGAGQVSWTYALALGSGAAVTGLSSDGVPVILALVSGVVVGSAGATPVFSVAVNAATGVVTLTQFAELDHPLPGSTGSYAAQLLQLAGNLIELRGTVTITDRDGDSISDTVTVDLAGNIRFADDGPSVSAGGEAPVLVVDETNFYVNATADLSGLFSPALDFGADGAGSVTYELGVTEGPSGLIDSLTGEAITLSLVDGVVYGRTSTHEAFRISRGSGGNVIFDQSRAIMHTPDTGPDQIKFLLGSNLITLTAVVTDGDGDTARSTADITARFGIKDDAPSAVSDQDNVARDGQTFADGNVLTGLGGSDENGTDGSPDSAGADGGLHVSGVAFGATSGVLGSALAGEYGSLTLTANGTYLYQLDPADPAVIALNANQTLNDVFLYTLTDADGDTSTAQITISITGANDFPIARADTNWVLDGPSGSDPSAAGNVLQNIAHPGAPLGSFADVADNDPDLEPITVTSAGTFVGLYGTLVIAADGIYTYTLNEDNTAVNALDAGQKLIDTFPYTVSDGLLSVGSNLSVTVFGTNDAPTIGTSIARVSEEGLADGIPDTTPTTLDTTNSAVFSGVLAIADFDAGETLTATLGNPGAVLTAGGLPVTWTGVGTVTLIGSAGSSEVIRVTLAPNGAYTVTLSRSVDHPNVTLEDLKEFNIPVSVSDGTVTTINATAVHIVVEDDAPTAAGETGSSTQPERDINTLFILDFSDSIDSTELDTMLNAVKAALTQLDNAASGVLGIKFVIFSTGSFASPSFTTAADANLYLNSLNPSVPGGVRPDGIGLTTNYTSAIQTALSSFSAVPGASNQVFFLSDGNPNSQTQLGPGGVINSLLPATASAWNNFVDNNNVNVTAIGIDNTPQPLSIERLRDVDLNDAPNNQPILVDDFDDLVATLLSVVVPSAIGGDLDANDGYGADGGRIFSITIGTVTYTWDGASSIAVSSGGTISGTSLTAASTPMGGALTLNFATGQYNYQPQSPITVTATETFSYAIVDRDGDTATAELSVTITLAAPPVVLDLDGDGVEFVSSAAGVNFDYAGDGVAESTAWVGRDDGLLVIDKNGDGKINNGSELVFGYGGLTDLQGLAATYDSNGDGKLDAYDSEFSKFGVWHDANGNGLTEAGELQSLAAAGITRISLVSDGRSYTAADGQVVVRGEAVYVRADGTTGRVADASFATNFVNDNQRILGAATNGLSTALLAAGLVAVVPLAAQVSKAPPSDDHMALGAQINTVSQMVEPSTVERAEELDLSPYYVSKEPEQQTTDTANGHLRFTSDEHQSAEQDGGLDAYAPAPAFTGLLEQSDIEQVRDAGREGPFASPGDQAPFILTSQISGDPTADQVKAIVAGAMEGRIVDIDVLLGRGTAPEHALPQIQLHDGPTDGFLTGGSMHSLGNLFMPDMAEQHIMAQMEHAAATGHV